MEEMVYVYTEQTTSPRFFEAIKAIKEDAELQDVILQPITAGAPLSSDDKVVVFGKITDTNYTHVNNIFTYSPAQVLTKANAVTVVSSALKRALDDGHFEVPQSPKRGVRLLDSSLDKVYNSLRNLSGENSEIVVDIETSGNLRTGTVDDEDIRLLTVAFYFPSRDISIVIPCGWYDREDLEDAIAIFLSQYSGELIFHNGKFDTRVMERILGVRISVDQDTMLMHHVLNQAAGNHKLKDLCQLYFGAEEWEADLKKYTKNGGHYELVPLDLLTEYNGLDVYWTYVLYKYLKAQLDADEDAQRAYQLELAAAEFLLKVEQRGIPFDDAAADELVVSCENTMQVHLNAMIEITNNRDFNPNSPKQVKEWLLCQGVEVSGTSVDIIEELERTTVFEHVSKFCKNLLAYRKAAKISSTYAKSWKAKSRNGRVHPTFLVHGTTTGRLSSTSPNAQNMPRNKAVRAIVGI